VVRVRVRVLPHPLPEQSRLRRSIYFGIQDCVAEVIEEKLSRFLVGLPTFLLIRLNLANSNSCPFGLVSVLSNDNFYLEVFILDPPWIIFVFFQALEQHVLLEWFELFLDLVKVIKELFEGFFL